MKLLLDTCLLVWLASEPKRLPPVASELIENLNNELFFSVASLWEIAIKNKLGRDDFCVDQRLLRRGLLENGYFELGVNGEHVAALELLPDIHKDPFDRMLVAQASREGIMLVTADATVAKYPAPIMKV